MHTNYLRYSMSGQTAAALRRDGFGWDHGMECVVLPSMRKRRSLMGIFNFKKDNKMNRLEHVNITVSNPKSTAKMLGHLFGWHVRWEGPAMGGAGYTVHVGGEESYVALYSGAGEQAVPTADASYATRGALNHIAVVVDDLDQTEEKVCALGFEAHSHADYEPGRRFYFHDADGVEFEIVSYP